MTHVKTSASSEKRFQLYMQTAAGSDHAASHIGHRSVYMTHIVIELPASWHMGWYHVVTLPRCRNAKGGDEKQSHLLIAAALVSCIQRHVACACHAVLKRTARYCGLRSKGSQGCH